MAEPDRDPEAEAEFEDARPATEAEWERQFRESEARAARYGDLLETLMDHPDRDAIVAQEMGWSHRPDGFDAEDFDEGFDDDEALAALEVDDAVREEMRREDEALRKMPAYGLAFELATASLTAMRPYSGQHAEGSDEGELFAAFIEGATTPAAKIAGGHAMGYEDDVLCGNIVCNRRALDAARAAREALGQLQRGGLIPPDVAAAMLGRVDPLIAALEQRLAELRARVWW